MRKEVLSDDITLYCGDCRDILPKLGKVDAVVTDPPYGVELKAKVTKHNRIKASRTYDDAPDVILPVVTTAVEMARSIAKCVVVTPGTRLLQKYPQADSIGTIFAPNGAGLDRWGFTGNNPILYYGKCPFLATGKGGRPNSFYSAHPGMHVTGENIYDHPCPKPIAWMTWLVARATVSHGETVVDPFMGSGTTGVACVQLGRKFIGIELEPSYFDIACRRISDELRRPRLDLPEQTKPVQEPLFGEAV